MSKGFREQVKEMLLGLGWDFVAQWQDNEDHDFIDKWWKIEEDAYTGQIIGLIKALPSLQGEYELRYKAGSIDAASEDVEPDMEALVRNQLRKQISTDLEGERKPK